MTSITPARLALLLALHAKCLGSALAWPVVAALAVWATVETLRARIAASAK